MAESQSNNRKKILALASGLIVTCVCLFVAAYALDTWMESDPEIRASRTMRAIARLTGVPKPVAQITSTIVELSTPTPYNTATTTSTSTPIVIISADKLEHDGIKFEITDLGRMYDYNDPEVQILYMELAIKSSNIGWTGFDVRNNELILDYTTGNRSTSKSVSPECWIYDDESCKTKATFVVPIDEKTVKLFYVTDKRSDGKEPVQVDDPNDRRFLAEIDLQNITFDPTPTATSTSPPTDTSTPTATIDKSATATQIPTNTVEPSLTPIPPLSVEDIYYNYKDMTSYQFAQFKKDIAGKKVEDYVNIGNVQEDGKVTLSGPWSPFLVNISDFCVVVTGVPSEVALSFKGDQWINLEASVQGIVGDYNYYINCENTLILKYMTHH